ncbi:MAG: YjhG/YagF family D-xylonate dehydratase [Acidobacteria bacterium]|nr:YjhG/YagF family D-xylonate dehydratase [Acidobacteriota bacterium]
MTQIRDIIFGTDDPDLFSIITKQNGPAGQLPLTPSDLLDRPSGDLFGWTQNAGMGWNPAQLGRPEVLILSTQGGIRLPDGTPLALGYHTGHWEVGLLMQAAAEELRRFDCIPFAGYCTDPCDGRSQGTTGMFDSLPYRNDAAMVLGRLIRSLPTRQGVIGVATCDKGLPAMMMALAGAHNLPTVLVPGGVTLPASDGEDAGKAQTIGARYANQQITLEQASEIGCRACGSPGGGCQFLGTAATSQVIAEALGLAVPHSALAPSGQPIWTDMARRSVQAMMQQKQLGLETRFIITPAAIRNAMAVHSAFGGSTNLLLHLPAVAHAAGLEIPAIEEWIQINRRVPRMVDSLPNGPHPTVRVFLAGGVPEVMLHLRGLGLIDGSALTAYGKPLDQMLDEWAISERRQVLRERLQEADNIHPDEVIMNPEQARHKGLSSTVTFIKGNLAPEGAIVKSTAIDRSMIGADGVYRLTGPARVFTSERATIAAIKSQGEDRLKGGEVIVLICRGPLGTGMEEVYQITSALKYMPYANSVALITDARFSGVSSGPCIGHVGPEALAGGPIGKLRDGDLVRVVIDTRNLEGTIDFVKREADGTHTPNDSELESRGFRSDLAADPELPAETRLWAALQQASGGAWRGSVYDVERILRVLEAGHKALREC